MKTDAQTIDENPDVLELLEANRAGCDHPKVPNAATRAEVEAAHARTGGIPALSGLGSAWCSDCRRDVLTSKSG